MISRMIKMVLVLGTVMALISCGSGTNNDQGTAFTLVGFFGEDPEAATCGTFPTGSLGDVVGISIGGNEGSEDTTGSLGGVLINSIGLQNNIASQGIRTTRVFTNFDIVGSNISPPSTSAPFPTLLGPGAGDVLTSDSSLPDSFRGLCNTTVGEFLLVPSDIVEWLSFNRGSLPEPPFTMIADVYVQGVTTAGDVVDSNSSSIFVEVTTDVGIPPTDGSGGDADSGGLVEDEEGDDTESDEEAIVE